MRAWLTICLFVVLTACGDYAIPLDDSYEIVHINSGTFGLAYNDKALAGPGPMTYSIEGDLAVGHVECRGKNAMEWCEHGGYFIVDLAAKEHYVGLSITSWEEKLRELGVREPPELKSPKGYHAWL